MAGATLLTVLYFLPSMIAFLRKKANFIAILLLNVLLGWTLIGWIVALVWSSTAHGEHEKPVIASVEEVADSGGKVLAILAIGAVIMYFLI